MHTWPELPETSLEEVTDFWVDGIPKPKGSFSAFMHPHTKKVVMKESAGEALVLWRKQVKTMAKASVMPADKVIKPHGVKIYVRFVLPRPKATPKTRATPLHVSYPDLDKLLRAIFDCLTGIAWEDDAQVNEVNSTKRIAEIDEPTGAQIAVYREEL